VLTCILIWLLIPNQHAVLTGAKFVEKLDRIDFIGAILLGFAILLCLLPLEIGGTLVPWNHPVIYILFAASVAIAVLYVLFEERWAKEPILSPRLLASRNVLASNVILFCQAAAQLGVSEVEHFILSARLTSADDVHSPYVLSDNPRRVHNGSRCISTPSCWWCHLGRALWWILNQTVGLKINPLIFRLTTSAVTPATE
jgi:hypothetical protein